MLESPTGTGKTLCLLSAVLAWRSTWVAKAELKSLSSAGYDAYVDAEGKASAPGMITAETHSRIAAQLNATAGVLADAVSETFGDRKIPLLIYASRTHSQLAQVVRELKATAYRPKISVVGSREHLCVNQAVRSTGSNASQQALCQQLVQRNSCEPFGKVGEALPAFMAASAAGALLDIEELQKLAKAHQACPYYLAREGQAEADVLFMPYNYLIDRRARAGLSLDLKGAVIIFDEAHNLEGVCGEAVSGALTSEELRGAAEETAEVLKIIDRALIPKEGVGPQECNAVQTFLRTLLTQLQSAQLEHPAGNHSSPAGRQGSFRADLAYELVQRAGVSAETVKGLLDRMMNVAKVLIEDRHATGKSRGFKCSIHAVADFLRILFRPAKVKNTTEDKDDAGSDEPASEFVRAVMGTDSKAFRVHIAEDKTAVRTLSLWCFCPGVALRDLAALGVRSIILASGTLSPLEPLALELQLPFNHRLENSHVINAQKQLLVSVLSTGPRGHPLNASYGQRDSPTYKSELGLAIAATAPHVPGGLLVFFPSYTVMDSCLQHWKETKEGGSTIWASIARAKTPLVEPRDKSELGRTLAAYERAVDVNHGIDGLNGAILFAVCRGKVSEGLDFADARGRAVIITGIPFPPARESRVLLKRGYLADLGSGLTGDQWYNQQAARAVNQAIGRVIRHRNDYGAIIFFDERFAQSRISSQLSKWIRPHIRHTASCNALAAELRTFFQLMRAPSVPNGDTSAVQTFMNTAAEQASRQEAMCKAKAFFQSNPFHMPSAPSDEQPAGLAEPRLPTALLGLARRHASQVPEPVKEEAKDHVAVDLVTEAKEFMVLVKKRLPTEASQRFTSLLKAYKAHKVDCPALLDSLLRLFHAHGALDLFPSLQPFLPERYAPLLTEKLEAFQMLGTKAKENTEPENLGVKRTAVQSFFGMAAPAPRPPSIKIEPVTQRLLAKNNLASSPTPIEDKADSVDACPICRDKYDKPFRAKCGHVCCFACWSAWLSNTLECPICRNRTRLSQLKKIY